MGKHDLDTSDDLNYWNIKKSIRNPKGGNLDDEIEEQRSLALSVSLLLKHKNISPTNLVRLPSHLVTSEPCQCPRSFHLFCTSLFPSNDSNLEMIYIHPAPRHYDKESNRRVLSSVRRARSKDQEFDPIATVRSEPAHAILSDGQLLEKKSRVPSRLPPRSTSLNIPSSYAFQRSMQTSMKSSGSLRLAKATPSNAQLQIHALSVFDQSPFASQMFVPRGPPPSPKTPTQESSMIFTHSIMTPPFRAMGIRPRIRQIQENVERKSAHVPTVKKSNNYEDHAREYLSASDCSDNENEANEEEKEENDDGEEEDKELNEFLTITQPKLPSRNVSLSRPGTSLRDRLISTNASRYISLAEVYYSSLDVYKHLNNRSRQRNRSQTRLGISTNEVDDTATTLSKATGTIKTSPMPPSKSSFGFSKTASSMHFGHAAGRLGLHGKFERWPQPLSRRTPFERKQEVTTLRLVTLPLVTS